MTVATGARHSLPAGIDDDFAAARRRRMAEESTMDEDDEATEVNTAACLYLNLVLLLHIL
jgi:hypothetical protein